VGVVWGTATTKKKIGRRNKYKYLRYAKHNSRSGVTVNHRGRGKTKAEVASCDSRGGSLRRKNGIG